MSAEVFEAYVSLQLAKAAAGILTPDQAVENVCIAYQSRVAGRES